MGKGRKSIGNPTHVYQKMTPSNIEYLWLGTLHFTALQFSKAITAVVFLADTKQIIPFVLYPGQYKTVPFLSSAFPVLTSEKQKKVLNWVKLGMKVTNANNAMLQLHTEPEAAKDCIFAYSFDFEKACATKLQGAPEILQQSNPTTVLHYFWYSL